MVNWNAFQQKALYIDPFNLTSLPRNFVVACYFQGDCAWANSSISFITLTSLTKKSHLMLISNSWTQPGSCSMNASDLGSLLFIYSFEVIFQDCLKTSLNLTSRNSWDLKLTMFLVLFLFVLQITDEYLWKGHALATMKLSHLSDSWCQRRWKYLSKQNHTFWEEQNMHSRDGEEISTFLQRSSWAGFNRVHM